MLELVQYIDPQGVKYTLHNGKSRFVISEEGTGMPPIEYVTQRGPFQHGESLRDYFLTPRIIQMVIRQNYCSRNEYWNGRNSILDAIRPNRQLAGALSPGKIRKLKSDGTVRDIDVIILQGPNFQPRQQGQWDEWSFQETLRFIAHNPIYYEPTQQSFAFVDSTGDLVFPITFPITFGVFGTSANITYTGTWIEYPTIVINGPITAPYIENVTTVQSILINTSINNTESITVDLSYGNKSITKNDGTNLIGYVSSSSDLADFHLAPDPEAPGGVNQINVTGSGTGASTSVTLSWYRRYIGV